MKHVNKSRVSLDEMYRQNWEHVRHVENERMNFTYLYMLIVTGILAFLAQVVVKGVAYIRGLFSFLVLLSVIGLLISLRLKADMEAHAEKLKQLVHGKERYHTFGAESGWTTKVKMRILFPIIYSVGIITFLVFAIEGEF